MVCRVGRLLVVGLITLLPATAAAAGTGTLTGTVKDKSGGALVDAAITVLTAQRAVIATTTTDRAGKFTITGLPDGQYLVIARYASLADRVAAMKVSATAPATVELVLDTVTASDEVTVTANQSAVENLATANQPVNVISSDEVVLRSKTIVAQAVEGETGVHLQRTSPGMAGIFVRGLTGNKVNIFVDGVRYSNGAQRGGVNTFLDLIDPSALEGIEVLRGTASAQYGSDALGGSVQFLTKVPSLLSANQPQLTGSITVGGETAQYGAFGAGTVGYSRPKFGVVGTITGRKTGDYRPGGGEDSHAATMRFFGLPTSKFIGDRMPDTGFTQVGGQYRVNWLAGPNTLVVGNYLRTRQNGANRWDQILGGDGNLIAELNDLQLDLGYVRVEQMSVGFLDQLSATYSFNTQREERVNQSGQGNPTASIVHQPERTTVNGIQVNGSRRLSARQTLRMGADAYFEKHHSDSFDVNPTTNVSVKSRPRVPDAATFSQSGVFGQTTVDVSKMLVVTGAVRAGFNHYEAHTIDAPVVNGRSLWPDDSLSTKSATFRFGATLSPSPMWQILAAVSSGYRAPHMTDLGTLGLTGAGFEVAAPDVVNLNAFVGTTAGTDAKSTGTPVRQVGPEKSLSFDFGTRVVHRRLRAYAGFFVNNIKDNIQKQALILPAGAVGTLLGGEPVTSQTADGAVLVALSGSPVLVRANFDNARIIGVETDGDATMSSVLSIGWAFTKMRARDTKTHLPPNIEGGTPAAGGTVWVRYVLADGRCWVQPYVTFAMQQKDFSSLDANDRRTGAPRTRTQIQNFFRNGAKARGWINPGPDGVFGTADDTLIQTGETLPQIQDRVLGVGVDGSQMVTALPAYSLVGVRFGLRLGPHSILIDAENLTDKSYRGISWGMDGPGRGISGRVLLRF